jgi:hypothetical protein
VLDIIRSKKIAQKIIPKRGFFACIDFWAGLETNCSGLFRHQPIEFQKPSARQRWGFFRVS